MDTDEIAASNQESTEIEGLKITLEKPQCPICDVKFSENRKWRDKLIKVNWESNLERHIQNFHRGAKIVSKLTMDDEMKNEEKCQKIEEIPATDENVTDNEMQMDPDTLTEIQMDTDKRAEIQMDTDEISANQGNLLRGIDNKTVRR